MAKEQNIGSDEITKEDIHNMGGRVFTGDVYGPWKILATAQAEPLSTETPRPDTKQDIRTTGFFDQNDYLSG